MTPLQQVNARLVELAELRQNLQRTLLETEARMDELHNVRMWLVGEDEPDEVEEEVPEPEPYPWPTEMFGVELTGLDERTRMMVMAGDRKTIEALGGTPPQQVPMSIPDFTR